MSFVRSTRRVVLSALSTAAALAASTFIAAEANAFCQSGCSAQSTGGASGCGGVVCHGYDPSSGCYSSWTTTYSCGSGPSPFPPPSPPNTPPNTGGGGTPPPTTPPAKTDKERKCEGASNAVAQSGAAKQAAQAFNKKFNLASNNTQLRQTFSTNQDTCSAAELGSCVEVKVTTTDDAGHTDVKQATICFSEDRYKRCLESIPANASVALADSMKRACAGASFGNPCLGAAPSSPDTIAINTCAREDQACGADCEADPLPSILASIEPSQCFGAPGQIVNSFLSGGPLSGPSAPTLEACAPGAESPEPERGIYYLAMGDSISSGEGSANSSDDYFAQLCHRSPNAYGAQIARDLGFTMADINRAMLVGVPDIGPHAGFRLNELPWGPVGAFAMTACSGDTANEFIGGNLVAYEDKYPKDFQNTRQYSYWKRPTRATQSNWFRKSFKQANGKPTPEYTPDLVTFTIGANDVGFGQFVAKCITGTCTEADLSLDAPVPGFKGYQHVCPPNDGDVYRTQVPQPCAATTQPETVRNKLRRTLGGAISLALGKAANAWIVVLAYPNPLPATHPNPNAPRFNIPNDLPPFWREVFAGLELKDFPVSCPAGITPQELLVINKFARELNDEVARIVDYYKRGPNGQTRYPNLMLIRDTDAYRLPEPNPPQSVGMENIINLDHSICDQEPYANAPTFMRHLPLPLPFDVLASKYGIQNPADTASPVARAAIAVLRSYVGAFGSSALNDQEPFHPNAKGYERMAAEVSHLLYGRGIFERDWTTNRTVLKTRYRANLIGANTPGLFGPNGVLPTGLQAVPPPAIVSAGNAASRASAFAPEAVASIYGAGFSAVTTNATEGCGVACEQLGGVRVVVADENGTKQFARLLYVSPTQINLALPAGIWTPSDGATVSRVLLTVLDDSNRAVAQAAVDVAGAAPALFTTNFSGAGQVSGSLVRVRDGVTTTEPIADGIDMGPLGDELSLVIYGTGFRAVTTAGQIIANIGGVPARVLGIDRDPNVAGVDRLMMEFPRALAARRGAVDLRVRIDRPGFAPILDANVVSVSVTDGEAPGSGGGGGGGGDGCGERASSVDSVLCSVSQSVRETGRAILRWLNY